MNSVEFNCPLCGVTLSVAASASRLSIELYTCPKCRSSFVFISSRNGDESLRFCLPIDLEGIQDEIERLSALLTDVYMMIDDDADGDDDDEFRPECDLPGSNSNTTICVISGGMSPGSLN